MLRLLRTYLCAILLAFGAVITPAQAETVIAYEFYNTTLHHYFRTVDDRERAGIEAGAAGQGWVRTGDDILVYPVDSTSSIGQVCRFYGDYKVGPNSHFYTADMDECVYLQDIQLTTADGQKKWNYEGLAFRVDMPVNGSCDSRPVYRAYNNGWSKGIDSNHRYTSRLEEYEEWVRSGWEGEGVVFCEATNATSASKTMLNESSSKVANNKLVGAGADAVTTGGFNPDPTGKTYDSSFGVHTPVLVNGNVYMLTPAEVIYYSAKENSVNPVLVLAKIQHEQGLITNPSPSKGLQAALDDAVGYSHYDGAGAPASKYTGFYPQLVAMTFQFQQNLKNQGNFLAGYSTDSTALGKVQTLYKSYAVSMNHIAGTSYAAALNGITGNLDDFSQISVADIQKFLASQSGRLKETSLFVGSSSQPGAGGIDTSSALESWQSEVIATIRPQIGTLQNTVYGSTCVPITGTYCYKWSRFQLGANNPGGYYSANDAFKALATKTTDFSKAPIGSIVFFSSGSSYGHAAIKYSDTTIVSQGNPSGYSCSITEVPYDSPGITFKGYYAPKPGATSLSDPDQIPQTYRVTRGDFVIRTAQLLAGVGMGAGGINQVIHDAALVDNPDNYNPSGYITRGDAFRVALRAVNFARKNGAQTVLAHQNSRFSQDNQELPEMIQVADELYQLGVVEGIQGERNVFQIVGSRQLATYERYPLLANLSNLLKLSTQNITRPSAPYFAEYSISSGKENLGVSILINDGSNSGSPASYMVNLSVVDQISGLICSRSAFVQEGVLSIVHFTSSDCPRFAFGSIGVVRASLSTNSSVTVSGAYFLGASTSALVPPLVSSFVATQLTAGGQIEGGFRVTGSNLNRVRMHIGESRDGTYACYFDFPASEGDRKFYFQGGGIAENNQSCLTLVPPAGLQKTLWFKLEVVDIAGNKANAGVPPVVSVNYIATPVVATITVNGLNASQSAAGQPINGSFSVSGSSVSMVRVHAGSSSGGSYACYTDLSASAGSKSFSFNGNWATENGLSCAALLPGAGSSRSIYFKVEARDSANNLANAGSAPVTSASYTAAAAINVSGLTANQSGAGQPINGSFSVSGSSVSMVRVHAGSSSGGSYACYTDLPASAGSKSFSFNGNWATENGLSCAALLPGAGSSRSIYFKVEARDSANNLANAGSAPVTSASYTAAAAAINVSGLTANQSGAGQPINGSFSVSGSSVSMVRVHAGSSSGGSYACYTDLPASAGSKSFSFNGNWATENGLSCAALLPGAGSSRSIYFKVEARDSANNLANAGSAPVTSASYTAAAAAINVSGLTANQSGAGQPINGSFSVSGSSVSMVRVHAGSSSGGSYACYTDLPASAGSKSFSFNGNWATENGLSCAALLPGAGSSRTIYFKVEARDSASNLANNGSAPVTSASYTAGVMSVSSISPASFTRNVASTITVIGTNISANGILAIQDAICGAPYGHTSTVFYQTCTPQLSGNKTLTVKTQSGGMVVEMRTVTVF